MEGEIAVMREPKRTNGLSRRSFAAALTAAPVLLAQQSTPQPAPAPVRRGPAPEVPPFQAPIEFARKDVPAKVQPFPMTQVKLLPSPYTETAEWNRGYMQRLPVDRLLYNFRENAGLPVGSAQPFGGWEAKADGKRGTELRGHFTGHFLTASAQLYASAGDHEAKAKADEMVAELAKCQQKLGGYLSAYPLELFDRLDSLSGRPPRDPSLPRDPNAPQLPWAPFYTIHKIMAGLFDMYNLTGNNDALRVVEGMAGWADQWSASKPKSTCSRF
jgi:DUF1680 family protein